MSEPATPETGALSVEQAVAALTPQAEPEVQEAPEAPAEAAEEPTEPEGETSSPEEPAEGAENPEDVDAEGAEAEPAATQLEPPLYWKPEAKARFAQLDPELQAEILAQEGPREAATAKAKAEAAELTQKAQAEIGKVQQLADALAERLPAWLETFKGDVQRFQERWGATSPDWIAYAQEHGVEAANWAKLQFDTELGSLQAAKHRLQEASQAQHIAQSQALEAERKQFAEQIAQVAPHLAAPEKQAEVNSYLEKQGIPKEALQHISATEMVLAHKAMLWDQAQQQLKAAPKPKPSAPAKPAPVRPAAAQAQSPTQRTATQIANRFAQTRSVDDAVALLLAKKA